MTFRKPVTLALTLLVFVSLIFQMPQISASINKTVTLQPSDDAYIDYDNWTCVGNSTSLLYLYYVSNNSILLQQSANFTIPHGTYKTIQFPVNQYTMNVTINVDSNVGVRFHVMDEQTFDNFTTEKPYIDDAYAWGSGSIATDLMANTQYYLVLDNIDSTLDATAHVGDVYGNFINFKVDLLKFDLTQLGSNVQVTKATLGLYASQVSVTQNISVFYSSYNSWTEKDQSIDLFDIALSATYQEPFRQNTVSQANKYYYWDVTGDLNQSLSAGQLTECLMWGNLVTGVGNYANLATAFNSKEAASSKPALTVEYTTNSLDVPYQGQGYTNWSGPTALAMVLKYYGQEVHSWNYAKDTTLATGDGINDLTVLGQYLQANYPSLTASYGVYSAQNKDQIFVDIKAALSQENPVILAVGKPPTPQIGNGGTVVVVTGFNDTGLFVNDPSGYLFSNILLTSPLNFSYNQAYVSWNKIKDAIVTSPYTSTLTIMGTPNPDSNYGTMYLNAGTDIVFRQPQDTQLTKNYTRLYLTMGQNWNYIYKGSILDPVVETACSQLLPSIWVSNGKPTPQTFNVVCKIIGPQGVVYTQTKNTGQIQGLTQTHILLSAVDLNSILDGSGPFVLDFSLLSSDGLLLDHFATPPFYFGGQTILFSDAQQDLYIHVYDSAGEHVGVNYQTNQTELGIPGSYYMDEGNGTVLIALPTTDQVKIVVDAKYAQENETYTVAIVSKLQTGTALQSYTNTINAGQTQTVTDVTPTPTTEPTSNPTTQPTQTPQQPTQKPSPTPTIPEYPNWIILLLIIAIILYLPLIKRKSSLLRLRTT